MSETINTNAGNPSYNALGLPVGEPCAFCGNEPVGRTEDDDLICDDCAVPL